MDSLAPNIFVKDIRASINFYELRGFNLVTSVSDRTNYLLTFAEDEAD